MTYAGDLSVQDAWEVLQNNPKARLIDVRTEDEWNDVGVPEVPEGHAPTVFVEWVKRGRVPNENFIEDLAEAGITADHDGPLLFICRSGVRSVSAAEAVSALGNSESYNLLGGFEAAGGWADSGLPTKA